ncbi:MAG: hypothetical protein IJ497_01930 [Clostridia bacterium]|nr:hypothetical protein [Clostridia bacterium]
MFSFTPPTLDLNAVKKEAAINSAVAEVLVEMVLDSDIPEEHKKAVRLINECRLFNDLLRDRMETLTLHDPVDPVKLESACEYVKLIRVNAETFFAALEKSATAKQ